MVLPYNNNVPQGPQTIASTQAPLLVNNQSIDAAFNDTTNGNFTKYVFQNNGTPTGGAPVNPTSILHTAPDALGNPALFFRNSALDGQLTGRVLVAQNGYSVLFGGLIIQWGLRPNGPGTTVTYSIAFPNNILNVTTTGYAAANTTNIVGALIPGGFSFAGSPQFFWLAIGF